ncbi:MAG: protein phosphatase CheZ [Ignavibacteriaceae bacterium]|nr:protein phosphatase CheZ [Ignavibacteriaceae bacterium]HRI45518.1 protein phosphatase CheZ [Ignavibacteriaceae bacterium]
MKQAINMSHLFEKLKDLKALFVYGEKLIPIIQSLVDFMKDTVPLLENINHSIADSTSKIPKASHQLNNVTSATELATTEILDLVDAVTKEVRGVEKSLKAFINSEEEKAKLFESLSPYIQGNPEALKIYEEIKLKVTAPQEINPLYESFTKIKDYAYNITLSLQVQDITAQQLAAVNHLIESVQDRLSGLISDLEINEVREFGNLSMPVPEGVTFDPNARYDKSDQNQQNVDEIIKAQSETTTQDEIDKLFS